MKYILKNTKIYSNGELTPGSIAVSNGIIVSLSSAFAGEGFEIIDCGGAAVFPGFADVHVHLREPGFSYKETIGTGSCAAARGGFTAVCAMPNLSPVPDCVESLNEEISAINRNACIKVYPYGAITEGEKGEVLSDLDGMSASAVAFSDDGKGVQSSEMMYSAMNKAKALGKIIAAHCEDDELIKDRICIHDGAYAAALGVRGVSHESEYLPIARDIGLAKKTGCAYHVCHISCAKSVDLIRVAKADGVDITCETAPHYLVYCDEELSDSGNFRMNPPIREKKDRQALINGIADGTIDMIATDHAPHSQEEKSKGILGSLNGVVGLETSFAIMYTYLVRSGIISIKRLVELMSEKPRTRFGLEKAELAEGAKANFTVFDLEAPYTVDPAEFISMGKSSPFNGLTVYGRCKFTAYGDMTPWREI